MREVHIDVETYSPEKFGKKHKDAVSASKYCAHPEFEILMATFKWDDGTVRQYDFAGDAIRSANRFGLDYKIGNIKNALHQQDLACFTDPDVLKIAHNASFEIKCFERALGIDLDAFQWYCTMIGAAHLGLPMGLGQVNAVLRLGEQKEDTGSGLIDMFCKPIKPTKANGGIARYNALTHPQEWDEFLYYNRQDVEAEHELYEYQMRMPQQPEWELDNWVLDQEINKRGFAIDPEYIRLALEANDRAVADGRMEMREITGLANPNSPIQLKRWIKEQTGETWASLGKDKVQEELDIEELPENVLRVLRLRQITSKSSVSKFKRMTDYDAGDHRNRDTIQYYGALRTGRYAGRGPQPHNFTKPMDKKDYKKRCGTEDIAEIRSAVMESELEQITDDVPEIIGSMTRPAIVAGPGKTLVVRDYSAIEARVLAWLAGEEWRLDHFKKGGDIYIASYAQMFNVAPEAVGDSERGIGKIGELALGYQGAVGAMAQMDKKKKIPANMYKAIVVKWRKANKKIESFWYRLQDAAEECVTRRRTVKVKLPYCTLELRYVKGYMQIVLPSGRFLSYYGMQVGTSGELSYYGLVKGAWCRIPTYGGSLVENVTQAVAADILKDGMLQMWDEGLEIVLHVHDEVVVEDDPDLADQTLELMGDIMTNMPLWAKGLPMKSSGYISPFYKKD